jgi:hypothetical protein
MQFGQHRDMAQDAEKPVEPRALRLRYAATCRSCAVEVSKGAQAWWWPTEKAVECQACRSTKGDTEESPPRLGDEEPAEHAGCGAAAGTMSSSESKAPAVSAGASAQRQYDRRAARERARQEAAIERDRELRAARREARPVLGRLVNALVKPPPDPTESQATRAWKVGAAGERRVAEILDATDCFVLHDRRIPGSKANIDHIAVGPAGVFVIDAKKYADKQLEIRDKGSFFTPDPRLFVGGRDQTKLVTGVKRQVEVVSSVLDGPDIQLHAVLCFVGAHWPGFFSNKPQRISSVIATYPTALAKLVTEDGPLSPDQIRDIGQQLVARLSPA